MLGSVFFFQAEDGIRDLVRSRGLGDVYKRQVTVFRDGRLISTMPRGEATPQRAIADMVGREMGPVSYTHLTLPTSDLV